MFGRRRGNFEEQSPVPSDGMTKYDEKFIFSTDSVGMGKTDNIGATGFGAATPQAETTTTVMSMRDIPPAQTVVAEKPMVFKLRANNDVYVYEYSDRLEYYLKTDSCMLALGARNK